ncbi:MAG: hypothetical protein PWP74_899 [Shewanella sp.]|jgi:hypothetical protein|uniref:Uncharacterized protein n=2 Tax=Shewanella fodinae TaxID=552357 RepID=A0A4V2RRH4_9GAMM|nr:hypothetical protein [Shewanella sp.]TCN77716.1 hypothetical protein EDC91_14417 [Shewanella fodinae]
MRGLTLAVISALGASVWYLLRQAPTQSAGTSASGAATTDTTSSFTVPDWLNTDWNSLFAETTPIYPLMQPSGISTMTKPYDTATNGGVVPRGITNNNPLNIRENQFTDYAWQGEMAEDIDPAFEEFTSPYWGIRAGAKIMKTYRDKYNLTTIRGIVSRWAPPEDNNPTEDYITFVSRNAGFTPDMPLATDDYPAVVAAMIHYENGYNPYDDQTISSAVLAGFA